MSRLRPLIGLGLVLLVPTLQGASSADSAEIYRFTLAPTARAPGARGTVRLTLVWSAFSIQVSGDGHLAYDLELTVGGLAPPNRLGPYREYVVWVATPNLDRFERLGIIPEAGSLRAPLTSWNKFLVLVTAEADPQAGRRSGPVVLQGRSPSGLLASFQSHELFSNIPH